MNEELRDEVAGVLRSEQRYLTDSPEALADALMPLLERREREAGARALREAADEIECELICCDVFERRDTESHHKICYWGGAARRLVLDRADAITSDATTEATP